jgi:hypothetical protein
MTDDQPMLETAERRTPQYDAIYALTKEGRPAGYRASGFYVAGTGALTVLAATGALTTRNTVAAAAYAVLALAGVNLYARMTRHRKETRVEADKAFLERQREGRLPARTSIDDTVS